MPFSINYNGSAPVHTYFVLHPAQDSGAHVTADPCKTFNDETCTAAISSFRGRHIHGVRQKLDEVAFKSVSAIEHDRSLVTAYAKSTKKVFIR